MPAQETKISLYGVLKDKVGDRNLAAFHDKVKGTEANYGFSDLPPGIKNGKCQVMSVKVGVYGKDTTMAGEKFVAFRMVVHTPTDFNGVNLFGRSFNLNFPMCDTLDRKNIDGTPKTVLDNYNELLNEFKKLGFDVSKTQVSGIDALIDYTNQKKPFSLFSTREWTPKKKNPNDPEPQSKVFPGLDGKCDPPGTANGVNHGLSAASDNSVHDVAEKPAEKTEEPADPAADLDAGDIDSLIARTKQGDGDAEEQVRQSAYKLGYDDEKIDDATSWEIVGGWIKEGKQYEPEGEENAGETKITPKSKEQYHYRPKDKKGVPAKSPLEVQVMKVDAKAETCKLKNLADGKTVYEDVPWSDLSEIPEA